MACVLAGCGNPVPPAAAQWLTDGLAAYRMDAHDEAIRLTTAFIAGYASAQEAGEAHYLRGLSRQKTGDNGEARRDFTRAVERTRRPELSGRAHLALGHLAARRGDERAAEAEYLAAVQSLPPADPPAAAALYRLAILLQRRGQWLEADRYFDRLTFLFAQTPYAAAAGSRVRGRFWTLHVASCKRRDNAARLAVRLRKAGWTVRIVPAVGAEMRLAVQAGRYDTHAQAAAASERLRTRYEGLAIIPGRK